MITGYFCKFINLNHKLFVDYLINYNRYIFMYEKKFHKIINDIQKVRLKINVNWMNILKWVVKIDYKRASKITNKINWDN